MAYQIQNSDTTKEIRDTARLSISEGFPNKLGDTVQAVIDVNPKHSRVCNITKATNATNSTSATIYTTPSDKDFYLVAASISVTKDATATSVSSRVNITVEGSSNPLLRIDGITLTAQTSAYGLSFPTPIKVDRGTNITITNTTNVANIVATGTITGFTVEP